MDNCEDFIFGVLFLIAGSVLAGLGIAAFVTLGIGGWFPGAVAFFAAGCSLPFGVCLVIDAKHGRF